MVGKNLGRKRWLWRRVVVVGVLEMEQEGGTKELAVGQQGFGDNPGEQMKAYPCGH